MYQRKNKLGRWNALACCKALAGEGQNALQPKAGPLSQLQHIESVIRASLPLLGPAVPRFPLKSPHQAPPKALHGNHGETQAHLS